MEWLGLAGSRSSSSLWPPLSTLEMLDTLEFTTRMCLALISQQYDPLGLLTPLFMKFKIAMRDVVALKAGWDKVLPPEFQRKWRKFDKELLQLPRIHFPRAIRPADPLGSPGM